jgi:uncharacterized membrane protein YraQ (UPF0718 family)
MLGAIATRGYGYRLILALAALTAFAAVFWIQSRYPNLNEKALMGGALELQDPLSFEAKYQLDQTWPLWKKIGYTTVNWIYTNRRGMMFGVLFGSAFLTMLRYLPRRSFKNGFANAILGVAIGAPLGVCVNCAGPIAAGMYRGGTRAETTLAAMIASPTFNVIVVSMAFALLPFYLAATKILLTLAIVLVAVPLICRTLPRWQLQVADTAVDSCIVSPIQLRANRPENLGRGILGFARDFLQDFWYISRMTVPMMILAGFLGALVSTLVPFDQLTDVQVNIGTLLLVAVVGVFAPVPMAFDVVMATVLLNSGLPVGLVMVLLVTLGSFSIYSFMIVSQTISSKAAILVAVAIVVAGVAGGAGIELYSNWKTEQVLKTLGSLFKDFSIVSSALAGEIREPVTFTSDRADSGLVMTSAGFDNRSPAGEKLFTRMEAWHRGIDRPNKFGMKSMFTPFNFTPGSVAAADLDNDGDDDVIVSSIDNEDGIFVFLNDGKGQFARTPFEVPALAGKIIFNAAPADIDNDGWLDLYVSTYLGGNFWLKNDKGSFNASTLNPVANQPDALVTLVAGFGDLDGDGYLDLALGNHQGARMGRLPTQRDLNRIVFNDLGRLSGERFLTVPAEPGDTLSILFSDFNMDGLLDYAEANDFNQPDNFFFGDGKGGLKKITRQDGIIPVTTHTTMSIKTADLDNDGKVEMLLSQIAGTADNMSNRLLTRPWAEFCSDIERPEDRAACQANIDIRSWYRMGIFSLDLNSVGNCTAMPRDEMRECKAMIMRDIAVKQNRPELCERIRDEFIRQKTHCQTMFEITKEPKDLLYENDIPQIRGRNVLLTQDKNGKFVDVAKSAGFELGGWSWDVKAIASANSELQDIVIFNGFWGLQQVSPSKVYLRNEGKLKFSNQTRESGFEDYAIIGSAAAADFDNDGDVDMVAASENGPLIAYWNNNQESNSIKIELRDAMGNRFGIGSKIRIFYGENDDKMQTRELQLSGGFGSYDAPYAHFGLSDNAQVSRIEVEWSTGTKDVLSGNFAANRTYRIERAQQATN